MPRKPKSPLPAISPELLERFGRGSTVAEAINATLPALKKALIERVRGAELGHHPGYPPGAAKPADAHQSTQRPRRQDRPDRRGPLRIEVPHALSYPSGKKSLD
jgi:putative transposase